MPENTKTNQPRTEGAVRAEERARIAAILEHPAARTRSVVARKLSLYTNLSVSACAEMLSDLPEEPTAARSNASALAFLNAMQHERVDITSALGTAPTGDTKESRLAELRGTAAQHNVSHGYVSPAAAKGVAIRGI